MKQQHQMINNKQFSLQYLIHYRQLLLQINSKSMNNASNEPTTYHIPPNYYALPPQQPSNYQMPYNPTQYNAIQYNVPQYNAAHYNAPIQYNTPSQYNLSTQYIHQPPYNPYMTNYQYYVPQASQLQPINSTPHQK
jgi:hypothetical protein